MSQSALTDPGRAADWDEWYREHLSIMVTVPGITSAQRFLTGSSRYAPSLAMYTVAGPGTFDDPYYRSVRGMGEWLPLIDRRHYHRNLFDGLAQAPRVATGECLLVADREVQDETLADLRLRWLACVGIDRSTPLRGIAVVDAQAAARAQGRGLAVYRPTTEYLAGRR